MIIQTLQFLIAKQCVNEILKLLNNFKELKIIHLDFELKRTLLAGLAWRSGRLLTSLSFLVVLPLQLLVALEGTCRWW